MFILGADPGFTGALCVIEVEDNREAKFNPLIHSVIDMPLIKHGRFGPVSHRVNIDPKGLYDWMRPWVPHLQLAVIEDVFAMPQQGLSSTFRFGEGYGLVKGVFAGFNIPTLKTKPSVWKAQLGVTSDKTTSMNMAKKIFGPLSLTYLGRKKDNGRAEALLLALFGARSLGFTFYTGEQRNVGVGDIL